MAVAAWGMVLALVGLVAWVEWRCLPALRRLAQAMDRLAAMPLLVAASQPPTRYEPPGVVRHNDDMARLREELSEAADDAEEVFAGP